MTEATAPKEQLVERVVSGPKGIYGVDVDGNRKMYAVGETIWLTPRAARAKARYLQSPAVAAAQAVVDKEKAEMDKAVEVPVVPGPTPSDPMPAAAAPEVAGPTPTPGIVSKADLLKESDNTEEGDSAES